MDTESSTQKNLHRLFFCSQGGLARFRNHPLYNGKKKLLSRVWIVGTRSDTAAVLNGRMEFRVRDRERLRRKNIPFREESDRLQRTRLPMNAVSGEYAMAVGFAYVHSSRV